jgi:hypothetical protein
MIFSSDRTPVGHMADRASDRDFNAVCMATELNHVLFTVQAENHDTKIGLLTIWDETKVSDTSAEHPAKAGSDLTKSALTERCDFDKRTHVLQSR